MEIWNQYDISMISIFTRKHDISYQEYYDIIKKENHQIYQIKMLQNQWLNTNFMSHKQKALKVQSNKHTLLKS